METIRIQYMLNSTSKHLIRIFKERFQLKTGQEWKDNPSSGLYFLKHVDSLYRCPLDKQAVIRAGDSLNWDISAIVTAVMSIQLPPSDERAKEDVHIKNIKTIRNNLAHASPKEMIELDKEKWNDYFKTLKSALLLFGENEIETDKYQLSELSYFSSASSNDPKFAEFKREGDRAAQAREYQKAIDSYTAAIMLDKVINEDQGYCYLSRSDAYYNWVKYARENKDKKLSDDVEHHYLNRALADLKKARQLLPDIPSFYAKKGNILSEQQEFDEALKAYDIALTHDSYNDELQRARDEAFKEVKKFSQNVDLSKLPKALLELLPNPDGANGAFSIKLLEKSLPKVESIGKGYSELLRGQLVILSAKGRPKYDEVLNWYMKAANKGNPSGMLRVGSCYMEGRGVKRDQRMAAYWFEKLGSLKATLQDGTLDPDVSCAQYNYGLCLLDGLGTKQDKGKGIEWMTKAANNGDDSALLFLGKRYIEGKDVQLNVKKGFEMLMKSAERGNTVAMDAVGSCYATGNGVDRNFNKAREWFERAKKRGYQPAQSNLMKLKDLVDEKAESASKQNNTNAKK